MLAAMSLSLKVYILCSCTESRRNYIFERDWVCSNVLLTQQGLQPPASLSALQVQQADHGIRSLRQRQLRALRPGGGRSLAGHDARHGRGNVRPAPAG